MSEKAGLKLNIQTKIMASSPSTSWQAEGEKVETVTDFIFLGSKITADGDCSHESKIRLLLRRKAITNLDSILKSRDIPLPTKVHLVKAMVFPVVMYGCESWTIKKRWVQKNWCFWTSLGEDSWESFGQQGDPTSQSQRKSVLNIHWKDWCWNSSTLTTWCKETTHWKRPWCWERLWAGGEGGDRGWDGWMALHIQWTWVWASWETVKDREACCASVHGIAKSRTWLSDWTDWTERFCHFLKFLLIYF